MGRWWNREIRCIRSGWPVERAIYLGVAARDVQAARYLAEPDAPLGALAPGPEILQPTPATLKHKLTTQHV